MESLNPPFPNNLFDQNYESSLNNLIQAVLNSPHKPKLSSLSSDFNKLLQCKVDPPFEFIWVYSALHFQGSENNDPFVAIKDLFQLIVSCSCSVSCNKFKSIALIAPVMYKLCKLVMEGKFVKEVKGLVDSVMGYVTLCFDEGGFDVSEGLGRSVGELVGVWMGDGKGNVSDFFPLLSDQIVERKVNCEGCELSTLAGCVVAEAFLLKLCLMFSDGGSRKELQEELAWIVASITATRNPYFFELLLMMLLEQSLPMASLLNSKDERCLRKILYDALVLVEYSFLKPDQMDQLPAKLLKSILMGRLLVTTEAIEFHRKQKGQKKAISYTNAFTSSSLPSQIIKWIRSAIGPEDKTSEPHRSSPAALLRWILKIESSGIRIFDDMSRIRAKSLLDSATEGFEQQDMKYGRKKSDTDLLFFIDNMGEEDEEEGDEKMNESTSAAFVAAAHTMQSAEPERKTKRKGKASEEKSSVKFLKYSFLENSGSRKVRASSVADTDDSSSESEVENPSSSDEE